MAREISEELGVEAGMASPEFQRDFTIRPRGPHRDISLSGSTGEWTFYDLELFDVQFADQPFIERAMEQNPGLLSWATNDELRAGRLNEGGSIGVFPTVGLQRGGHLGE
jgi:8-oxo-dGTP pyrophosphatase MutT (NUDIX family)